MHPLLPNLKNKISRILPILFLLGVATAYYWPQVSLQALPFSADPAGSDLLAVHYTYFTYAHRAWRHGIMPLWSSLLGGGTPFFAEGISSYLYPLTLIFSYLFSESKSFLLLFPVHSFLASVSMYYFARTIGIGRFGAVFSGIAWAYSGYFVGHLKHVTYFMSAALVPLPLAFLFQYYIRRSWKWVLATGLTFTLILFAGSVQVLYQSVLLWGIVMLCIAIRSSLRILPTSASARDNLLSIRKDVTRWLRYALAAMTGFALLSSIQLAPTWELSRYAERQNIESKEWSVEFPFHPQNLLTFVAPFHFGNPAFNTYVFPWSEIMNSVGLFWENIGYIGLLPIAFSLVAIPLAVRRRSWRMGIMMIVAMLGISLVLGPYLPFYQWFWRHVPFFSSFRVPGRYLLWVTLSLSILAGYACGIFLQWLAAHPRLRLSSFTIRLIGLSLLATAVFDLSVFGYHYNAMDRLSLNSWIEIPTAVPSLRAHPFSERYISLFAGEDFSKRMLAAGGWQNDLWWIAVNRELLPPNYSLLYGVESWEHYTPLSLARADALRNLFYRGLLVSVLATAERPQPTFALRDHNLAIAARANVRTILSPTLLSAPLLTEPDRLTAPSGKTLYLYHILNALPRAYLTTDASTAASLQEASARLTDPALPLTHAVVETITLPSLTATSHTLMVEEAREGYYRLSSETDGDILLVLNESFYPGWEARIDGVSAVIYPANLAFQAIVVPAGTHEVEFRFRSNSFLQGAMISGTSWTLLIAIAFIAAVSQIFKRKSQNHISDIRTP